MNAIEIKGLCKYYPGFALEDLDLVLPAGCILGLVGENGAGKSTTIRLLLDLIRKDAGSVTVLGREVCDANADIKKDLGVVLDTVGLPLLLKTKRIGRIMKDAFPNWDEQEFENLLDRFNVPKNKVFRDMSNGMKMKTGLAVALAHHPKLLILDEATNGLDPVARDDVNELLMEFTRQEDHSVLISSHLVSDLEKICDYIAFLHKGKLLLCEEKDTLAEAYGKIQCGAEDADSLPVEAVLHRNHTPYGEQLFVKKDLLPAGFETEPVSIEDLFVIMAKETK